MKIDDLVVGRVYRGPDGRSTRKIISIDGAGRGRTVQYRDIRQQRQRAAIALFAQWARCDATPVSIVALAR